MDNTSQFKIIRAGFRIIRKEETPRPRILVRDKNNPAWTTWFNCTSVDQRDQIWDNLITNEYIIND